MVNRLKRFWLDIVLVIIVVLGATIVTSQFQANTDAKQEKARLETRTRATQITISQVEKEIDLESLSQSVEQARSALSENPFPNETEAVAATDQIMQEAKDNHVTITDWDSSYTSDTLNQRKYPAISHSLTAEGEATALTRFVKALTTGSKPLVIQNITINEVSGRANIWQMKLELLFYYH